ncbi:complex I NDUFA9 subunit family protein [Oceanicella actignis]|uniref:NADH dehydrogenase n=1 Tax=Oceanicella actignis TaxID=1189325 RepID=A0A1M7TE22_9RHOB|nr:complex I NDUFA9 subunit family protein [Oceanicella actignis]TYO88607.1 NADH dehydrogenase [Oceanicella actignis]SET62781.1 NADH dehydrogenase [Oceanicella actignis]SHN68970.1 NADH dehydrogenase [Oceanicella actignis]
MTKTAPIVTIFGGSGFIGRYVVQRMARRGWRVRVAVRRPNEALFTQTYGDVGQVVPIQANIRDDASTRAAIRGADAVINCVGILFAEPRQGFDDVHVAGAERVARIAAEEGARTLVHVSAIGADPESDSDYARSKGLGEAAVRKAFPGATILRPSVVFGPEDQFFNRFAAMARISPVLPIVGGRTRLQPVYVNDVAEAAARCAAGEAAPGTYELGGPDIRTFRELMELMLRIIRRRRLIVDVPLALARLMARTLSAVETITFGLVPNRVLTLDQIRQLSRDNVAAPDAPGLAALGIAPTALEAELEAYLYVYRPYGQYARVTEQARRLRHLRG